MQWVFGAIEELLPILVFFVVQAQVSFVSGVVAMTVVLVMLLCYARITNQRAPRFALVSTVGFLLFALPTIVTGQPRYFQLSDTILDGFFALLLLGCWFLRYPVLKVLFGSIFAITDRAWLTLSLRWGLLFLLLAVLNEYVRQTQTPETWAVFKLSASVGIVLFGTYQFTLSMRERLKGESNWLGLRTKNDACK